MKNRLILLVVMIALYAGCHSKTDVLPTDVWSEQCVQLIRNQDGYRLAGMCCEYVEIPGLILRKDKTFSVNGSYFTFTGAGFARIPIQVSGYLSSDGTTLTINYTVNSATTPTIYTLTAGPATMTCNCGCD